MERQPPVKVFTYYQKKEEDGVGGVKHLEKLQQQE